MCSVQLWTSCSSVAYDMAEGWRMVKNHAQLGGCWRSEQARHWHVAIDWYIISITSSCLVYSPSGGERPALEIWVQNSNAEILNIPSPATRLSLQPLLIPTHRACWTPSPSCHPGRSPRFFSTIPSWRWKKRKMRNFQTFRLGAQCTANLEVDGENDDSLWRKNGRNQHDIQRKKTWFFL